MEATKTESWDDLPKKMNEALRLLEEIKSLNSKAPVSSQNQKPFLSSEEAASFLSIKLSTLYSKISRREIPFHKKGGTVYFSAEDLTQYLISGKVNSKEETENLASNFINSRKSYGK